MAAEDLASTTPEDVQHNMADTRHHLGDQVQALGEKIADMARDASDAVAGAVQGGKDAAADVRAAVGDAGRSVVAGVKHVLDVRLHVRRHPWLAVGCAAALGFCCAGLFRRR